MKKRATKKNKAESAEAQNRCIWMTAGVISFKLCPLGYDCEHCDLDKAMRTQMKSRKISSKVRKPKSEPLARPEGDSDLKESAERPPPFFTFSPGREVEGLYLHSSHLWAKHTQDQMWKVGIDGLLAYTLPPATKLEWYGLDKNLVQEQVFGKILTQTGTVFLIAPLSGCLTQANSRLVQNPELLQKDPYGEGWLAIIEWTENKIELESFYTGNRAKRFLDEEAQHLKFLLKHRGVEVDQIGETLPDGGANIRYLHQVLPGKVCLRLAVELTATGKQAW
jgi:glycine cleavage system H lipoate-binding protein